MRFQLDIARRVVIYLLSCAAVLMASPWASLAQQRGGAEAPPSPLKGAGDKTIAISTDLVSLHVNVTDKEGRFAPGLDRGAFAVYEDGVRQEISFFSEHDEPVELVKKEPGGSALVAGVAPIRDVNRDLALDLPEEEGSFTMAGLCTALAGRIPKKGTRMTAKDGTVIEVVEASARMVR